MEKQSKSSPWIFIIEDESRCSTSFTHPEESILTDDLEGNLYRLGLRLEEIQDEIGDKLGNDGIQMDENSNYSVSPRMLHCTDSKRSYEGECSETETTKGENNLDSDDDVNLELYGWKPATEDITELNFYKKQFGEQYLGLDPIYLSRSNSAPGQLSALHVNGNATITPNNGHADLPKDSVELNNSQKSLEDNCVKKRKSRNSPTVAMETLHLKKSPTPEKSASAQSNPNAILTSTEDSGFLEGSHPSQQSFPSRHATSPLRNHYRINEKEAASFETTRSPDQEPILEESAGERYRQRLDSLRSYILAKRAANNSLSALENSDKKSRNVRGKKTSNHNYRISPRLFNKVNVVPKTNAASNVNDPGSSTTESVLSSAIQPVVDEKAMPNRKFTKEEKPAVQRQDIDTLRDEMRGVKDIVLDLKNSLTSPNRSPSQISVAANRANDSRQVHSLDNLRNDILQRDEVDTTRERSNERVAFPQVEQLQNKQFEMLEKLDNKLDDISKKLQPTSANQRQSHSRGSVRLNTNRLDSPSRYSHVSSYYNQVGEENIGEVNRRPSNVDDCEVGKNSQQTYTLRPTENIRDLNQRYGSCDNFVLSRDNCAHDNDIAGYRAQAYSHRPVPRLDNSQLNQRPGRSPLNHHLVEDDDQFNDHSMGQRTNFDLNDGTKSYHEKFDEIGDQINELTSHVKECKENEEKRLRDETLNQQKQLVEYLREKLQKLSTRIEEQEKKTPNVMTAGVSPLPVYVISCPMCGRVGAHQHGGHYFNGHHIEQPENTGLGTTNPIHPLNPIDLRQGHTTVTPVLPNTNARQNDDTFKMHSTPKNDWESQGNRSPSPIVYHHYHTVYSPQQEEQHSRQPNGRSADTDAGVRDLILSNRMCDSLEKASLAAMHMESLSKKMLRGITTDLFNSGPAEF